MSALQAVATSSLSA